MASGPTPTTAARGWRAGVETALAERDALAAELAARGARAAVRTALDAWLAASSDAESQATVAAYRELSGSFRDAERAADQAWRNYCRIVAE